MHSLTHLRFAPIAVVTSAIVAPLFQPSAMSQSTTAPAASQSNDSALSLPHIEQRGTGDVPMILIPGLACDWTVFDTFMTRNADQYTMYAIRLPGFGGSASPQIAASDSPTPWLDYATEAIWSFIEQEGIAQPVIIGHSLGGYFAMRLGAEHPNAASAIVSIDGAPCVPGYEEDVSMEERRDMEANVRLRFMHVAPDE